MLRKFWVIGYRDLVRNRRRSLLTLLAVAFGLTIILLMSGFIAGMLDSTLRDNIRLSTGHLQVRTHSYEPEKRSLARRDLLAESGDIVTQINRMPEVKTAGAVLWTSGILSTIDETVGLQVNGIDPTAVLHDPIREGIVAGSYFTPESRNEILLSQRLADEMGIAVGQRVSLGISGPEGVPETGIFTVIGLFNTGFPGYDESMLFLPLRQAQSFTGVGDRASAVIVLLKDKDDTEQVAARLVGNEIYVATWVELNALILESVELGASFYAIMYAIVMLIVAVIIANTLLMSVFERTREMGILAALGMRSRQILLMFLFESTLIALAGIVVGVVLGSAVVLYLAQVGLDIGDASATAVQGMTLGTKMYTALVPADVLRLSLALLGVVLLVSLYPAWYAARLEPVDALHTLK